MRAKGWIGVVFGVALLALIGWRVVTHNQTGEAMTKGGGGPGGFGGGAGGGRNRPSTVEVATVKSADILNTVNVVGNLESPNSVDLSPRITGRIEFLQAREGDPVTVGQVLVRIDPSDLNQQILQAQANVAEAKSKLAQARLTQGSANVGVMTQVQQQQAAVASAQADYNQTQQNYQAQVQTAQANVTDAGARLNAANVQVKNAQAQLAQQQSNLKNAQAKLQRMTTLFSQGAVSQQQLEDAQNAADVAQQNVNVAEGQIAATQANVTSAQASQSSARDQLSIVKKQGIANIASSKAKLVQAQASLKAAIANKAQTPAYQANIEALQAGVAAAQAQYQAAKVHLQDTVLKSPINGAVTARAADQGDLATPGKAILTVQSLDWLYVNAAVPLEQATGVSMGMNAQVTIDTLPNQIFTGAITNFNPSADPQSRQYGIRIRLQNPQGLLRPGMFARVGIVTQSVHAPTAVPIEAINRTNNETTVTVVDKDSVAHVMPVVLGATDGKVQEIKSGVKRGDQVVTLSYSPVRDGATVMLPGQGGGGSGEAGGRQGGRGGRGGGQGGGGRRRRQQS